MTYNYYEAVKNDVLDYIENEIDLSAFDDREELEETLNDDLFTCDSVTGNASGSYTFSRATAKNYVLDNMELVEEVVQDFGIEAATVAEKFLSENWEYFDVSIRCYVLGSAICEALDELEEEQKI